MKCSLFFLRNMVSFTLFFLSIQFVFAQGLVLQENWCGGHKSVFWTIDQGSRFGVGRKLLAAVLIQINIPNSES